LFVSFVVRSIREEQYKNRHADIDDDDTDDVGEERELDEPTSDIQKDIEENVSIRETLN
jgi:hypothetical protein